MNNSVPESTYPVPFKLGVQFSEILAKTIGCFTNDFKITYYCVNSLFISEESLKI
jgi:hypothetical protein